MARRSNRRLRRADAPQRWYDVWRDQAIASPARFAILVFSSLIAIVAVLLSLPIASASGQWTDLPTALFTATSTICVTGLTTVDMATYWSPFGHTVIFIGVQIGAVGVLTLASLLGLVVSRRMGLRAKLMAASDSNPMRIHHGPVSESQAIRLGEMGGLLLTVAGSMLVIEVALAILLLPSMLGSGLPWYLAMWHSLVMAAMAFTNTGFILVPGGMEAIAGDGWALSMLMVGVFLGSLGFLVIFAFIRRIRGKIHRFTVHVKLTVTVTLGLFVAGAIMLAILEMDNPATFGRLDAGETIFQSMFLSMMSRSGGFSTVDISEMHGSTLLVLDMLMFVGGGSASTAGGIKVTTLAVLFLAIVAEARGFTDMEAFGRRIPNDVLRVALSVLMLSATTIATACILILHTSGAALDFVLFDVISAFGTAGLSTGLTASLDGFGQLVLVAVMWMGRVGTVTLAVAVAARSQRRLFRHAEERPIVG